MVVAVPGSDEYKRHTVVQDMSDLISPPRPTFSFLPHSSQIAQKKETYGDNLYGIYSNESKYEVTLGSGRRPRTWSRVLECTSLIIAVFLNVLLYGISSTVQMQSTSVGGQICCAATSILSIPFVYYLTIRNKKIKLLSLSGVFLLMISSLITCLRPSELAMFVAAGILGIATTSNVIALFCISHSYFANHNFIFLLGNSLAIISLGLYIGIVIGYNAIALYIVIGLSTIMLVVRIFIPDGSFRSIQSISPSHSHASSSLTGFPCISSKQSPKNEEWRYLIKSLQSTEFSLQNVITLSSTSVMVGILLTIQPLLIQHYPSQAENVYVILIGLGLLQILSFSLASFLSHRLFASNGSSIGEQHPCAAYLVPSFLTLFIISTVLLAFPLSFAYTLCLFSVGLILYSLVIIQNTIALFHLNRPKKYQTGFGRYESQFPFYALLTLNYTLGTLTATVITRLFSSPTHTQDASDTSADFILNSESSVQVVYSYLIFSLLLVLPTIAYLILYKLGKIGARSRPPAEGLKMDAEEIFETLTRSP